MASFAIRYARTILWPLCVYLASGARGRARARLPRAREARDDTRGQTRYDSKGQYERVVPQLLAGETPYYVFDLMALVTIPYARISYVAIQTERKLLGRDSSSVTGQTFEFIFHGVDKTQRIYQVVNFAICK